MNSPNSIERYSKIREIVEKELSDSAHDLEHVTRVHDLCLRLAKGESYLDLDVLRTAAWLHDIGIAREDQDNSGNTDHALLAAKMAERILRHLGDSEERIDRVKHCILAHRFRSSVEPKTKEAMILFDADKLDALGAIGVARSFMLSVPYAEKMFSHVSVDEYIKDNLVGGKPDGRIKDISKHSPNLEFEIKSKHILERLWTANAREIAKHRVKFMEDFFKKLREELGGVS